MTKTNYVNKINYFDNTLSTYEFTNPAQKVSGHNVSKNDNMGQKVSSQKVSS